MIKNNMNKFSTENGHRRNEQFLVQDIYNRHSAKFEEFFALLHDGDYNIMDTSVSAFSGRSSDQNSHFENIFLSNIFLILAGSGSSE